MPRTNDTTAAASTTTTTTATTATSPTSQHDGVSVSSSQGTKQQKRFSFYDASETARLSKEEDGEEEDHSETSSQRFNFYDAEEVKRGLLTLETIPASPAIHGLASPGETALTLPAVETHTSGDVGNAGYEEVRVIGDVESKPSNLDSIEILRSLQETEQQRIRILSTPSPAPKVISIPESAVDDAVAAPHPNPYEDAIKEALQLLRRYRASEGVERRATSTDAASSASAESLEPSNVTGKHVYPYNSADFEHGNIFDDDNVGGTAEATSLGNAYQAEIEARLKQRKERMAHFANRLAALKQQESGIEGVSHYGGQERQSLDQLDAAREASPKEQYTIVESVSSLSYKDDDHQHQVQLGVERVLLAILDRANSRGRARDPPQPIRQEEKKCPSDIEDLKSLIPIMQTSESDNDDALKKAMSDLLRSSMSGGSILAEDSHTASPAVADYLDSSSKPSDLFTNSSRVIKDSRTFSSAGPDSGENYYANTQLRTIKSDPGPEAHAELDRMVEKASKMSGGESCQSSDLIEDRSVEDALDERIRRVLSKEPIDESTVHTGLAQASRQSEDDFTQEEVDDDYDESEADETTAQEPEETLDDTIHDDVSDLGQHGVLNGVLGPLSVIAGGKSGVVLDAERKQTPSILDSLSAAARNLVAGVSPNSPRSEKDEDSESEFSDEEEDDDDEGEGESDEDDANDLMHTICAHLLLEFYPSDKKNALLRNIPVWDETNPDEPGYRIIRLNRDQLRLVDEEFREVLTRYKQKERRKLLKGNADDSFERDLEEAENILQNHEKRRASLPDAKEQPWTRPYDETECLTQFPGVKPTGQGEMGDLEYFHLPIIFKSHVTGFEPTKDMYLEAGNIVAGQYLVEGELGSAAFSTAYRCVDLSSEGDGPDGHEEVCLKVIKNTKDFFDQSLDEIKILELLRLTGKCHEMNILEMRTFFYHREHLIIVTELLRQNLFEFGKFITDNDEQPYFTMQRLSYITRQVLIAMKFIHGLGLIHSDVKPENILLASYSRARVKLIDFGSSCYLTDRQSSYIQSRSYRAPEVILGLPYDGRIDIWSLGCVVAEMYTGEVTFQNDSVVSMLSRIEAICGPFPRKMVTQGRQSSAFFVKSGLLYEKVRNKSAKSDSDSEDESSTGHDTTAATRYDIFQPKRTTLAARLGFDEDLMTRFDAGVQLSGKHKRRAIFVDFIRSLLTVDPDKRPTAEEALKHPWMEYAATLTEDDIKYP